MKRNERGLRLSRPRGSTVATSQAVSTKADQLPVGGPVSPIGNLEYEAGMFLGALKFLRELPQSRLVKSAMIESVVLHARTLCGVFLNSGLGTDGLTLVSLFPDYPNDPKYRELELAIRSLREVGGEGPGSPFYELGKHIASVHGTYGAYDESIEKLEPAIVKICMKSNP